MSSQAKMHPRNIFRTPPDYTALAIKYKEFRQVCKLDLSGKVSVDYREEKVLLALTQMLLKEYFQLNVEFAPGSLIPTVPLRLNYILWLEDLLAPLNVDTVCGIDVGCGSSCIYSLLAARKNGWHMYALESNDTNINFAGKNVQSNGLQDLVEIFPQSNKDMIFKDFFNHKPDSTYQFCLCNPPFYDASLPDPFSGNTRNAAKRALPRNCRTGQAEELACVGGEVQFVQRIIEDSLLYKQRITLYTSMLGHKSSLTRIVEVLQKYEIGNYCTTEFCQGNTTRWGIAWTFSADMNLEKSAEISNGNERNPKNYKLD